MINTFNKRLFYPTFWIFVLVIQIIILNNFKTINESVFRSVINTLQIIFVFYFNKYLVDNDFDKNNIKKYLLFQFLIIISISLLRRIIEITLFGRFLTTIQLFENKGVNFNIIAIAFNFFATTTITILSSLYFIGEKNKALELKNSKLKIENLENKMEMLNNQLSSHFLFNSLNDIYASAVLQNGVTPEMILKLSNIMRFITYDAILNEILFYTELQQAKNYISFFEIKSDNKLHINFKDDNNDPEIMVMPMLLIPLIENALKHGNLNDTEDQTVLNIDVSSSKNELKIIVGNSYQSTPSNELPKGIGLSNYKRRLELRYPNKHFLKINVTENYYETTLTLSL